MRLQQSLQEDLIAAIKAKDNDRTGAIRILIGEFARQKTKEVDDEQVVAIIKKLIKSERELLTAQGHATSSFLSIMEEYLPRQVTREEVCIWVEQNIDLSLFTNKMQAMKPIMQHFGNNVDGKMVSDLLQSLDRPKS